MEPLKAFAVVFCFFILCLFVHNIVVYQVKCTSFGIIMMQLCKIFLLSLDFMLDLIYKTIPVIFANIYNALIIKDLKLDHVFNLSVKHAMFHVTVTCFGGIVEIGCFCIL